MNAYRPTHANGLTMQVWGGPYTALRAYQHWHPNAAIYDVTYRNRTVWMTSKQRAIWHEVNKYWMRGKRDTLERIAKQCNCSKATVSRFLRRLDQWRFIDLIALRGRTGGTYVFTRPANEPPRIWTKAARFAARVKLAAMFKRYQVLKKFAPKVRETRTTAPVRLSWQEAWTGDPRLLGKTSATFRDTYGARRRHA